MYPFGTKLIWKKDGRYCDYEVVGPLKVKIIRSDIIYEVGTTVDILDWAWSKYPSSWRIEYPKEVLFNKLYERLI